MMDKWLLKPKLKPSSIPRIPSPPEKSAVVTPQPAHQNVTTLPVSAARFERENKKKRHFACDPNTIQSISCVENNSDETEELSDTETVEQHSSEKRRRKENSSALVARKKTPLAHKFVSAWLDKAQFKNWLKKSETIRNDNEYGHCKICNVDIAAHKIDLQRHAESTKHKNNVKEIKSSMTIPEMTTTNNSFTDTVRRAELKMCSFLASQNLPFLLMDTLTPLCANLFPDSKIAQSISVKRTKATAIVKNNLAENLSQKLYFILKQPGCFFSVIMDETTDTSTINQCAITVLYYCEVRGCVATRFFDMVEVKSANADGLWDCLKTSITSKNIPLRNLVGFSADTCNVMFGEHHSVSTNMKVDLPHVVAIKCSCHMIHLAATKACLKLPRSVEDLLRNLGSHFHRSYARIEVLKEFQQFFKIEMHKILSPAITRWLSLKACVDRVLEQYEPLTAYLTNVVFEDPSKTTAVMLETMKNKFTKIYLEFMAYVLGLLTDFNTLFQSETPLLHRLKPETERLLKNIYGNYMDIFSFRGENLFTVNHTNPRTFVPMEKLYLGVLATDSIQHLRRDTDLSNNQLFKSDLDCFYKTCLEFYIELASQIKARFKFKDDIFDIIEIVDPTTVQKFQRKSLSDVLNRFPILMEFVDKQALDNEWRELAYLDFSQYDLNVLDVQKFWKQIFAMTNSAGESLFSNLRTVINLLIVLPFSNASVERIFSNPNNIKTENRNKLATSTVAALIHTKQGIAAEQGIITFEPTKTMLRWNNWATTA